MKITLHGAAGGEVTGSAYQIRTSEANLLVDFGFFQGRHAAEERNRIPEGLGTPDAVLLTHAHLDHTGRLPLLSRAAFAGPVFCTPATVDLTALILRDSAKVQAGDTERANRKRMRAGEPPLEPLYTTADVEQILGSLRPVPYSQPVPVAPGIEARFLEAGHMLGSSSIQLRIRENGALKTVVFSGDIGPKGAPILRDAEPFHKADLVFLESTYGDHDHKPFPDTAKEFRDIVARVTERRGKILVPTFAVGRAQVLTVLLAEMFRRKLLPEFPVFLDSPMAVEASKIYARHRELFDEEMMAFVREQHIGEDLSTAGLRTTVTVEESRALNDLKGPCLIMAGAGMCTGGRILHHLRQNLWKPETAVLIVGYQAQGSLGRMLVDGRPEISIFGEKIAVRASIHTLGGFSAHAGRSDLSAWFDAMAPCRPQVCLTHGESRGRDALAALIRERHGIQARLPALGETMDI